MTRFARRGSARLAYEPVGSASDTARTIVLLHDLLADRSAFSAWRPVFEATPDASPWRLILPDARGHGASATPGNQRLTLQDLAADVLAVLDAEEMPRAHLVGHGLGGAVALVLAHRAPERVESLVTIEPALPGLLVSDPNPAVRAMAADRQGHWRTVSDLALRGQTDQALDLLLTALQGADWREQLPRPRQAAIRRHAAALGALLAALNAEEPSPDELRAIACPTLVIQCDDGDPLNGRIAAHLLDALPNARSARIANVEDDDAAIVVREFIVGVQRV